METMVKIAFLRSFQRLNRSEAKYNLAGIYVIDHMDWPVVAKN